MSARPEAKPNTQTRLTPETQMGVGISALTIGERVLPPHLAHISALKARVESQIPPSTFTPSTGETVPEHFTPMRQQPESQPLPMGCTVCINCGACNLTHKIGEEPPDELAFFKGAEDRLREKADGPFTAKTADGRSFSGTKAGDLIHITTITTVRIVHPKKTEKEQHVQQSQSQAVEPSPPTSAEMQHTNIQAVDKGQTAYATQKINRHQTTQSISTTSEIRATTTVNQIPTSTTGEAPAPTRTESPIAYAALLQNQRQAAVGGLVSPARTPEVYRDTPQEISAPKNAAEQIQTAPYTPQQEKHKKTPAFSQPESFAKPIVSVRGENHVIGNLARAESVLAIEPQLRVVPKVEQPQRTAHMVAEKNVSAPVIPFVETVRPNIPIQEKPVYRQQESAPIRTIATSSENNNQREAKPRSATETPASPVQYRELEKNDHVNAKPTFSGNRKVIPFVSLTEEPHKKEKTGDVAPPIPFSPTGDGPKKNTEITSAPKPPTIEKLPHTTKIVHINEVYAAHTQKDSSVKSEKQKKHEDRPHIKTAHTQDILTTLKRDDNHQSETVSKNHFSLHTEKIPLHRSSSHENPNTIIKPNGNKTAAPAEQHARPIETPITDAIRTKVVEIRNTVQKTDSKMAPLEVSEGVFQTVASLLRKNNDHTRPMKQESPFTKPLTSSDSSDETAHPVEKSPQIHSITLKTHDGKSITLSKERFLTVSKGLTKYHDVSSQSDSEKRNNNHETKMVKNKQKKERDIRDETDMDVSPEENLSMDTGYVAIMDPLTVWWFYYLLLISFLEDSIDYIRPNHTAINNLITNTLISPAITV